MLLPRVAPGPPAEMWEAFWRESTVDGCTLAFPAAARGGLAAGWQCAFARLARGARILDVGCGKGAVLNCAAASGLANLVGVDLAPAAVLAGNGFEIHGGVDARALPFSDRSFDVVVSQFGLEYAGLEQSVDEAARVCRHKLIFLLHAADGIIVEQAAEQVSHAKLLDHDLEVFTHLKAHFGAPTHQSAAAINRLLAAIAENAARASNVSLLEGVYRTAIALQDDPDPVGGVHRLAAAVRGHAGRMRALIDAAPDQLRVDALGRRLEAMEFSVQIRPEGGNDPPLIGRWVEASRSKGG